jgi:phospho-N-acetylmuramoyl-pentapeptide-transferase
LILASCLVATILLADPRNAFVWIALFVMVAFGAIGFSDDYLKLRRGRGQGLSGPQKLFWQFTCAFVAAVVLFGVLNLDTHLTFPFFKRIHPNLHWWLYVPLAMVVIVGCSNAVNLTDGLDGLAIGCTLIVGFVFLFFTYLAGNFNAARYLQIPYVNGAGELTVFCAALIGAGLGFLWFNCHPARVFMGDTGSLPLGGAFGIMGVLIHQPFILVIAGGVFVMEAVSVILQTGWFRFTRKRYGVGRRIFLMAPLHHHFEKKGWYESQVVMRFYILCVLFAVVALATLKLR